MAKITEEQKQAAQARAEKSLEYRQETVKSQRSNSFAAWGNGKCISRTQDTIEAMENGRASDRQYQYWLNH